MTTALTIGWVLRASTVGFTVGCRVLQPRVPQFGDLVKVPLVDDDINIYNEAEVMWAVATRIQPDRDVVIIPDTYVCELDPSAYDIKGRAVRGYMNSKWFIDATKPCGLPFQERADVPEDVWKNINLDEYV